MARYTVENNEGKRITFDWEGEIPPTDTDMESIFAEAKSFTEKTSPFGGSISDQYPIPQLQEGYVPEWGRKNPNLYAMYGTMFGEPTTAPLRSAISRTVRPTLELGGMTAGGILGSPTTPAGTVAGEALGYVTGKQTADALDYLMGLRKSESLSEAGLKTLEDIKTGAEYSMMGQSSVPIISKAAEYGGKLIKPILGRLSGLGTESVTQAIKSGAEQVKSWNIFKSGTQFDKALRGKITGEEVVKNAKSALETIKTTRGKTYRSQLEKIKVDKSALNTIKNDLDSTMLENISKDNFDIKPIYQNGKYKFDFSESTIVEHQPVVQRALEDISTWKDTTAAGLDSLKKRIGTYIKQVKNGTPAEALLTRLKTNLSSNLEKNVPQYAEMTKGYSEITNIIKDIESGLMLRKQGMTGRIVADQTLRRLTSSMKDNFVLRKELVEILGEKGGEDLLGQIAGYGMRSVLPVGLAGTAPVLLSEATMAKVISPKLWPVLLASSPRVQGEFLRMYGNALNEVANIPPEIFRNVIYTFGTMNRSKDIPDQIKNNTPKTNISDLINKGK